MAEETKTENLGCELHSFERNRYFYGKLLTVQDFEIEQRYLIGKDHLINSHVHGAGIVCGLELTDPDVDNGTLFVNVTAGVALDCCGNEIIVSKPINHLRVRGTPQEGLNYLYLYYVECVKQPMPALTNASTCEEVCCYNRIQESYEVRVSAAPPTLADAEFLGDVVHLQVSGDPAPLVGARIEALQNGVVQAFTLTDAEGHYSLAVVAGTYDIRASATGYQPVTEANRSVATGSTLSIDFTLEPATESPNPATLCQDITQRYYAEHLRVCPQCQDPKVLLAVVNMSPGGGQPSINQADTRRYRSIVYSNPMLHDLLCDHVADFHNPHQTTAADVKALQSINNVGNVGGGPHVSNVDLTSSNGTVQINPDPTSQHIDLTTTPAVNVTSVGPTPVVGNSLNFAREDHVHDLTNGVVQRVHLNNEVITNLLTSDGTITVTPDTAARTIALRTTPATSVTSVGASAQIGTSLHFAREDHVHNVRINDRGPDANGAFRLSAGANVSITPGALANELIIAAAGGGTAIDVPSGRVIFLRMNGLGEIRESPPIDHGLRAEHIAIVLALELGPEGINRFRVMGDTDAFPPPTQAGSESPLMWAVHADATPELFRIILQDRRPFGRSEDPPPPIDFVIRWWAIPKTVDRDDVPVPPNDDRVSVPDDFLVGGITLRPGITINNLAAELRVERAEIEEQLQRLAEAGRIRIDPGERLFPA